MDVRVTREFQSDIDAIHDIESIPSMLDVIKQTTGMGFVAVARVTEQRWIACEVLDDLDFGLKPGGELKIETTICHEIRQSHKAVAIDHVAESGEYADHHTPRIYGLQSYISVPITLADGSFFGTLCAIDSKPALVNNSKTLGMFKLFAELIARHLDAREKIIGYEEKLREEIKYSELKEQFIAVLGHDLRNPLASMVAGTRVLAKTQLDDRAKSIVGLMLKSVDRMSNLVDNVMDFARARLGGGIRLNLTDDNLEPTIVQVIDELRSAFPDRVIQSEFDLKHNTRADHPRLAQLFSNLLGNAIAHGLSETPIVVRVSTTEADLELSVINGGEAIPSDALPKLFLPFTRSDDSGSQGLGLGLYIASEIARAHGGHLTVLSDEIQTCFTLRIPRLPPA